MLVGDTPGVLDVRRRLMRRHWTVIQAGTHVRGIRRWLVTNESSPVVLIVSAHPAVARRYGRHLPMALADRASFSGLALTIVLLESDDGIARLDTAEAASWPGDVRVADVTTAVRYATACRESVRAGGTRMGPGRRSVGRRRVDVTGLVPAWGKVDG